MTQVQLIGRSSSHFTRVTRMFAHELGVEFTLVPLYDMAELDPQLYADNPALKLPNLRVDGSSLFGTENICRRLEELAFAVSGAATRRVIWPEQLRSDLSRNAQELVWHSMAAQVQLVVGLNLAKLPPENLFFAKARLGYRGALSWLDQHLAANLAALPANRDISLFEVTLFCLLEHIVFRPLLSLEPYPGLRAFAANYGVRPSALATSYQVDVLPA